MVSDNLTMANAEFSNAAFRLGRVRLGKDNFLGNGIVYPASGRTGDNVLFGTKAMIPIEGALRQDTGLLGCPLFEIPRTVLRDPRLDRFKSPAVEAERLRLKNRYNLATMAVFLAARLGLAALLVVVGHGFFFELGLQSAFGIAITAQALTLLSLASVVVIERATCRFKPLTPQHCSIYEPYFWWQERYWKMSVDAMLTFRTARRSSRCCGGFSACGSGARSTTGAAGFRKGASSRSAIIAR